MPAALPFPAVRRPGHAPSLEAACHFVRRDDGDAPMRRTADGSGAGDGAFGEHLGVDVVEAIGIDHDGL